MAIPNNLTELENNLNEYIQSGDVAVDEENFKDYFKKLNDFIGYYDDKHIDSMSLQDYCVGFGNDNSFCNIVERKLWAFGSIRGGSSNKFGLYWSKKRNSYVKNGNPITNTEAEAELEKAKKSIKEIKKLAKNKTTTLNNGFENINLGQGSVYKNKLYCLFDIEKQMPIYSEWHLKRILLYFGLISKKENKSIYEMRIILYDFYKDYVLTNEKFKGITPVLFMSFLYKKERDGYYPYRKILIGNEKTNVDTPDKVNDQREHVYEKEDVEDIEEESTQEKVETEKKDFTQKEIEEIYKRDWKLIKKYKQKDETTTNSKKKITSASTKKPDQPYLDNIGKLGENIVKKQLESLVEKNVINTLKDRTNQYSEGYDFSFIYKDVTVYVDVKSTTSSSKNNVNFHLSINEYNKMMDTLTKEKKDHELYRIFYINDIKNSNDISILIPDDIDNSKEVSEYLIRYKQK